MNYTDDQLKKTLAKMLPQCFFENGELYIFDADFAGLDGHRQVCDTELLHLCWLLEENLTEKEYYFYADVVCDLSLEIVTKRRWFWLAMPWQQRVEALAKVKGVELKEEGE